MAFPGAWPVASTFQAGTLALVGFALTTGLPCPTPAGLRFRSLADGMWPLSERPIILINGSAPGAVVEISFEAIRAGFAEPAVTQA